MKSKLVVLAVVLALVMGGCSCKRVSTDGVVTESATNCLTTAQEILCSPTPEQQATGNLVVAFLSSGAAIGGPIVGIPITPGAAQAVFTAISKGLCVGATDLQYALAWYNAVTATPKAMVKGAKAAKSIPDVTGLYAMFTAGK